MEPCDFCGHEVEKSCAALNQVKKCEYSLQNPKTPDGSPTVRIVDEGKVSFVPLNIADNTHGVPSNQFLNGM